MSQAGGVADLPCREVAVEIAKISVVCRSGIEEQNVARFDDPIMWTTDDLGNPSRSRDRRKKGRRIGAALGKLDSQFAGGVSLAVANSHDLRNTGIGIAGKLADMTNASDLRLGLHHADLPCAW